MSLIKESNQGRSDAYLIVKRELFYCPDAKGYTGVKDLAGRYTLAEVATRFPNLDSPRQDGMYFVHEDDAPEFSKACCEDIKGYHLQKKIEGFKAKLAAADALARAVGDWSRPTGANGMTSPSEDHPLMAALAAYREATK